MDILNSLLDIGYSIKKGEITYKCGTYLLLKTVKLLVVGIFIFR